MNFVFVDLQGFKMMQNRFMCKEFCLIDGEKVFHTFVRSPFSIKELSFKYRHQAKWLTRFHHKIPWDYGIINLAQLKRTVYPMLQNKLILVNGIESALWLKYIFRDHGPLNVQSIAYLKSKFSYLKTDEVCRFHSAIADWSRFGPCAMRVALDLKILYTHSVTKR